MMADVRNDRWITLVHCAFAGSILAACCGCVSPYAGRERELAAGKYLAVRRDVRRDLAALGQIGQGIPEGTVEVRRTVYDTRYLHEAEIVRGIVPEAYNDFARASLRMHRYLDAVRSAKDAIRQGQRYYNDEKWAMRRLLNLIDAHGELYEAYLYLGDLESAAESHREFLLLCKITGSKAFKEMAADSMALRLTSMRLKSDYLARQHWHNFQMVLVLAASAAEAQHQQKQGRSDAASDAITQGVLLATMIADLKTQLQEQHGWDLAGLMRKAEATGAMEPPTEADIRRAKMASRLYTQVSARDIHTDLDTVRIAELRDAAKNISNGISMTSKDGKVSVRGDVAGLLAVSLQIDEVPLKLPAPPPEGADDYLDKYLTADLYRMAGLKMSEKEVRYLRDMLAQTDGELTLDLSDERDRMLLNGLRRMLRKTREFENWATTM